VKDKDLSKLVERARKYDSEAFGLLYERFVSKVYGYIYYRIGNRVEAEDLTAQTFLKALDAINRFDGQKASFLTWLIRIANNLTIDYFRLKGRRVEVPLEQAIGNRDFCDTEEIALTNIVSERVMALTSRLTGEQRQVMILKFNLHFTNGEIAKVMDKTEGSVKSLQHRALSKIKKVLKEEDGLL